MKIRSGRRIPRRNNSNPDSFLIAGSLMAHRDEFTKPILSGKGATDYERYLHTDELLSLQKSPEELLHKDEMTFLVVHQSSELLMKGGAFELGRALEALERGDYGNTTRLIRRAILLLEPPIGLLHILERSAPAT